MIEGTIDSVLAEASELRWGIKVYLLTEEEYKDLKRIQDKESWQAGLDEGRAEGYIEGRVAMAKEIERVLAT